MLIAFVVFVGFQYNIDEISIFKFDINELLIIFDFFFFFRNVPRCLSQDTVEISKYDASRRHLHVGASHVKKTYVSKPEVPTPARAFPKRTLIGVSLKVCQIYIAIGADHLENNRTTSNLPQTRHSLCGHHPRKGVSLRCGRVLARTSRGMVPWKKLRYIP